MNFVHKESLSAGFSLKKFFASDEFMITLSRYTSVPSSLCFESFTACKCGSCLMCFYSASFATFSVPLIHLSEKFLISFNSMLPLLTIKTSNAADLIFSVDIKICFHPKFFLPLSKCFYCGCFFIWSHCI